VTAHAAACLVALALAIGLPHFMVLCTPVVGTPHVDFVCSAGCHHDATAGQWHSHDGLGWHSHGRDDEPTDGDPTPSNDHPHGCVHAALAADLGPMPRAVRFEPPEPEPAASFRAFDEAPPRHRTERVWSHSTDPPRPRSVLKRIACTVLRQ